MGTAKRREGHAPLAAGASCYIAGDGLLCHRVRSSSTGKEECGAQRSFNEKCVVFLVRGLVYVTIAEALGAEYTNEYRRIRAVRHCNMGHVPRIGRQVEMQSVVQ